MMASRLLLARLLDWCEHHRILIDPRIQIRYDEVKGVHVISNTQIPPDTTLVRIPREAILSVKSCSISGDIPFELYGLGAQLGLSFALYNEILKDESSPWHAYLQSLSGVDLPVFWQCNASCSRQSGDFTDIDGDELLMWLRGTEVLKRLNERDDNNRTLLQNIDHYYDEVVLPTLQKPSLRHLLTREPDLAGFRQAYSLVSSRAFLLDAYHGLSMTPVADAFNHVLENHVHLQSDFYVCPECGSFRECEHDYDDYDDTRQGPDVPQIHSEHDLYYEMVSNRDISPHEEVFNTYGENLCNAQLLIQYGFILDPNDNDTVNFDAEEIFSFIPTLSTQWNTPFFGDKEIASTVSVFGGSGLIFPHNPAGVEPRLCINSDGKVSHQLWILIIELVCQNAGLKGLSHGLQELQLLVEVQMNLESAADGDGDGDLDKNSAGYGRPDLIGSPRATVLLEVARIIIGLCGARRETIGPSGLSGGDLGDILDTISEDRQRTRLSLSIIMSERSILDSCRFSWEDFVSAVGAGGDEDTFPQLQGEN